MHAGGAPAPTWLTYYGRQSSIPPSRYLSYFPPLHWLAAVLVSWAEPRQATTNRGRAAFGQFPSWLASSCPPHSVRTPAALTLPLTWPALITARCRQLSEASIIVHQSKNVAARRL